MRNILAILFLASLAACGGDKPAQEPAQGKLAASASGLLPSQGEKIFLPDGGWFTWEFPEKPKLATVIAKVQVFAADGTRSTSYAVTGEYGMPSMRYHDSGSVGFKLNKRGDYLLPVEVVMPGEWQLMIKVSKEKEPLYEGQVLFNI